jgi:hypothetical protein
MYTGELVFTQLIDQLPMHTFRRCIQRYGGNQYVKRFTCQDQYRCMAFAQLTYRESLRDIEACLRAQHNKLYIDEDFGVELDNTQTFIFANNPST